MIVLSAAWCYRLLIRLYPHPFWREFHDELEDDFADGSEEARSAGGWTLVRFWIGVLADLAVSLARQWLRTPWLPVLTVAAALSVTIFGVTAFQVARWPAPLARRIHASIYANNESLTAIVVLTAGALIPIAAAILASLWATRVQQWRRADVSRRAGVWRRASALRLHRR